MIVKLKRGGDEHSLEGKSEKDNWEINVKGNNRELLKFKHIVKDLKRGKINDGELLKFKHIIKDLKRGKINLKNTRPWRGCPKAKIFMIDN